MKRTKQQLFIASILLLLGITPVFASNGDGDRVTDSDSLPKLSFPPVTAGPGYILPDSPFYFVDKLYQQLRLGLVFSAENKAELHNNIGGERLAELRVMASRGNQVGIDTALVELSHEAKAAAIQLEDASAQGKDVKELAKRINDTIRQHREVLQAVAVQVDDTSFGERLLATDRELFEAKVMAEESLPDLDRDNEIARAVEEETDKAVLGVTSSAGRLEKRMDRYEKLASIAAQKRLEKEKQLKTLQEYKLRLERLKANRQQELDKMKKAVKEMQDAAKRYRELQKQELKELKSPQSANPTP